MIKKKHSSRKKFLAYNLKKNTTYHKISSGASFETSPVFEEK